MEVSGLGRAYWFWGEEEGDQVRELPPAGCCCHHCSGIRGLGQGCEGG